MKTKEQWAEDFKENFLDGNFKYVNEETKHIPKFIEQIQFDAFKAGVSYAASMAIGTNEEARNEIERLKELPSQP